MTLATDPSVRYAGASDENIFRFIVLVDAARNPASLAGFRNMVADGGCPLPSSARFIWELLGELDIAAETIADDNAWAEVVDAIDTIGKALGSRGLAGATA